MELLLKQVLALGRVPRNSCSLELMVSASQRHRANGRKADYQEARLEINLKIAEQQRQRPVEERSLIFNIDYGMSESRGG
jgi:hypothetical protein